MKGIIFPSVNGNYKKSSNYEIIKKIEKICDETPIRYYGDIKEGLFKMFHPEKERMYIED